MYRDRQTNRKIYQLIITRRTATEILLVRDKSGWRLPRLEVESQRRIAEVLTAGTREAWGLETYCLFIPRFEATTQNAPPGRCAVMESAKEGVNATEDMKWVPTAAAMTETTLPHDDYGVLKSSLEEMERYIAEPRRGPFGRPGWIMELLQWVRGLIGPSGPRLTGNFKQFNASPTFSLIRIETTGPGLWFKATGEPNSHELPVTVTLARLFPRFVPELWGVQSLWNGWLAHEAPGATLAGITEISAWTRAAKALAELQIASVGKQEELLESGCQDLRLPRLIGEIDPFLSRASELMDMQTKQSPAALTDDELELLGGELKAACLVLQDIGIAETLGHVDFNPGNILVSPDGCRFLDWAEACVTHPFITFQYLEEHSRHQDIEGTAARAQVAAYLEPWSGLFSPDELTRALSRSPLVAVFAYSVGARGLRSPEFLKNPTIARYFRSLSRRMYREAVQLRRRSEPCLA